MKRHKRITPPPPPPENDPNKEFNFQRKDGEKALAELKLANKNLVIQSIKKEKRAAELIVANEELILKNAEKERCASELISANRELVFQNTEREKRAAELIIQNKERENRAAELIIANKELAFQNKEKEQRAIELDMANVELIFQNKEKEARAAELVIINKEHTLEYEKSLKEVSDYKYALDESSIVAITNEKGIIRYVNDNFCTVSKYSREELQGQDHRIVNSGYHSREFMHDLWNTIESGKIWRGDIKNKNKEGAIYWVDDTIVPFLNADGKPYQYVAITTDITNRKKLEEQQALFASIVNSSDDGILSKNLKGIIVTWNHGAEKIFGYSPEEIIGKHITMLSPPNLQNEENEILEKILKGETVEHFETERKRKDGKIISVSLTVSPVKDQLGNIIGASKISRDITQRKLNEAQLSENLLQLERANKELESFSYSVSHDLRAPLRAVNGYARMLEEDYNTLFDTEGNRLLNQIQNNAKRMGFLIDDLLAFSRLGRQEVKKSVVDMNVLIETVLSEIKETIPGSAIIKLGNLLPLRADQALLGHVVSNLLSNAVKYSSRKENAVIEIDSKKEDGEVIYSIKDNGVGFDMQYVHKLFGVFQRLHASEEFAGTGVGLAIVQRIIYKHEGKIWAEGKMGEGATFFFSLPE